jgi:purine catabolism regulator
VLKVRDLIELPHLRTTALAGKAGLDREVRWAHVCELDDPTEWLGAGDLLLTAGLGIPQAPQDQCAYLERLAHAGLGGIAIGHRMYAPPLSKEMMAVADAIAFPVLMTSYEIPFTAVARAVADANHSGERARMLEALRLYQTIGQATISKTGASLLADLERIVGASLSVLDHERALWLVEGSGPLVDGAAEAMQAASAARDKPMPAVLRLEISGAKVLAIAIPTDQPATLVAVPGRKPCPDLALLQHAGAAVGLDLQRTAIESERRQHSGAEMLAGLVDGRISADDATSALRQRGLDEEPRVLAVFHFGPDHPTPADMHRRLEERGIGSLLLRRTPQGIALIRDRPDVLDGFLAELPAGASLGLSSPLGRPSRAAEAQREAVWALEATSRSGQSAVARYGDTAPSFFLPRGISEAERAVRVVLGPLFDYDAQNRTELVKTLQTFLESDRSWKVTAEKLYVHKQTLVHRMQRIEQLTGRRAGRTEDIAEFWFALRAAEMASIIDAAAALDRQQDAIDA